MSFLKKMFESREGNFSVLYSQNKNGTFNFQAAVPSNQKNYLIEKLGKSKGIIFETNEAPNYDVNPKIGYPYTLTNEEAIDFSKISYANYTQDISVLEARDPDLEYEEKYVKKILDRIIVELENQKAGAFTKLAAEYKKIDNEIKTQMAIKEELNQKIKEKAEALFDASDVVYTRVVETASLTATLSKNWVENKTSVNHEKILIELQNHLTPELLTVLKDITTKYTLVGKGNKEVPVSLRVKIKEDKDTLLDKLSSLLKVFFNKILGWARSYDYKLAKLNNMM